MSIDDKLKEILVNITTDHDTDTLDEVTDDYISQIKKCFIGEGWRHIRGVKEGRLFTRTAFDTDEYDVNKGNPINKFNLPMMTGQEWYTRFEKEIDIVTKYLPDMYKMYSHNMGVLYGVIGSELDRAARRATGIE